MLSRHCGGEMKIFENHIGLILEVQIHCLPLSLSSRDKGALSVVFSERFDDKIRFVFQPRQSNFVFAVFAESSVLCLSWLLKAVCFQELKNIALQLETLFLRFNLQDLNF